MKKRTKKYRPKQIILNPVDYLRGGYKRVEGEYLTELQIKNEMALLNVLQGKAATEDWDKLVGAVNMSLVITEQYFDDKFRELLLAGRDALQSLGKRQLKIGRFVLTGEEKTAIENMMEVHEAQLKALRVVDIERAYDEVMRRLRSKTGNVKVVEEV